MPAQHASPPPFCGLSVTTSQLELIKKTTCRYPNLSRTEIASTLCELLEWLRPNGKPKTVECRNYLEQLEDLGMLSLPGRHKKRPKREAVVIQKIKHDQTAVTGNIDQLQPLTIDRVTTAEERNLWRSLVDQHHYLGHKIPFGAHLRYLIHSAKGVVGCLQYSSPARRLKPRDQWIGWSDSERKERLQQIVCNSRFLILPWVNVPNLASHLLAKSAKQIATDWHSSYHIKPLLLETMVDPARFQGTCYRAANWVHVGESSGRGRNDTHHQHHGEQPKSIWLYPLRDNCQELLSTPQQSRQQTTQQKRAG